MKKMLFFSIPVGAIVFLAGGNPSPHFKASCRVKKVIDGDSIRASCPNYPEVNNVRLKFIDAPELKQFSQDGVPIGDNSKLFLEKLLLNKLARLHFYGRDRYNRALAVIWHRGENINIQIVSSGQALLYGKARFPSPKEAMKYKLAILMAKWKKRGIWSSGGFLAPFHYRKAKRP